MLNALTRNLFSFGFILFLATWPLPSLAQKAAPAVADCYKKSPDAAALMFLTKSKESVENQFYTQMHRCSELNPNGVLGDMTKSETFWGHLKDFEYRVVEPIIGNASSAFDLMRVKGWSTPEQNDFKAKIDAIKQISDRNERIEKVYALIHRVQGVSGSSTTSGFIMNNVDTSTMVNRSHDLGGIGTCHENASLLYWAINQVGRYANSKGSFGALDPATDFSASMMYGIVPTENAGSMYHQWVRLNMPVKDAQGSMQFKNVDVDTTQYPNFTPLEPRRTGLSATEQKEQFNQCMATLQCLGDQAGKKVKSSDVDGSSDSGAVL